MLSRLRDFVTRHRRKFLVTGVVFGGAYVAIRYAQRKVREMQEQQTRELIEQTRRMQHFESTERTCNQVIIGMCSEVCQAIIRECSTDDLIEQLRQNPANKLELWEEMKIVAFTRLTTFIYASSMLVIVLRVQLNLLGGYLYQDITTEQKRVTNEVKQQYLSLIQYFVHEGGLSELIQLIRSKVVSVMKSLSLTKRLTLADLEAVFWSLQMAINSDRNEPNLKMSKYLLPAHVPVYSVSGPLLQKMFTETLDLLESDDAVTVCSNNICRGFSLALDAIAENLGETILSSKGDSTAENRVGAAQSNGDPATSAAQQNNNSVLNISNVPIPLAKLIPITSGLTSQGFDTASRPQNLVTSLVTFYVIAEKAKTLGANVYETFSSS